jgi:hypothetical protein
MKARKKLPYVQLISEIIGRITEFKPQPSMVKEQVEKLFDSQELKRDEKDRTIILQNFYPQEPEETKS